MDHREVGYHHKQKLEVNMNKVHSWHKEREVENLPEYPKMLDLWLKINNRLGIYFARKIWGKSSFVILRFVADDEALRELSRNVRKLREEYAITIFLVASEQLGESLLSMGARNVAKYQYTTIGYDHARRDLVLAEFSSYGNRILTLPNNVSLSDIELPEENLKD